MLDVLVHRWLILELAGWMAGHRAADVGTVRGRMWLLGDTILQHAEDLVTLLQSEKLEQYCALCCQGYFDKRDDTTETQHDHRFGLVFKETKPDSMPKLLHRMLPGC